MMRCGYTGAACADQGAGTAALQRLCSLLRPGQLWQALQKAAGRCQRVYQTLMARIGLDEHWWGLVRGQAAKPCHCLVLAG